MRLPSSVHITFGKGFLICFSTGLALRLIPELLASPYPISWDMLHYAYFMRSGIVWQHWSSFFTSSWLLYSFLFPIHNGLGVDSFLLLKITGPVLFGLNVCGIYWFATSLFGWSLKKSLLAGGFFSVQLASLRISAEFLRNTLGLGLLLFALPLIRKLDSRRGFAAFVMVSLLAVFAHEYAAVTLLVIGLTLAISDLVRGDGTRGSATKRLMVAILPALLVFWAGLFLRTFPVAYEQAPVAGPNVVRVKDTVSQSYGKLFFLVDYLGMNTGLDVYPNYLSLLLSVSALFAVLYLPYVYLVWKGFFRNRLLSIWTGLLLVGSFGCLVMPFCALQYWHRWMFMLAYPFTFYAVNGVASLLKQVSQKRLGLTTFTGFRSKVSAMILATVMLGAVFLATPFLMVNGGFGIYSLSPICRYFCSSPAVPYQDIDGTIEAVQWLADNMQDDAVAVLQDAFVTWAKLHLETTHNVIGYVNDVELAVNLALQSGYEHMYLLCWNENVGWYGVYVPEGFAEVQSFCRISVYEYVG